MKILERHAGEGGAGSTDGDSPLDRKPLSRKHELSTDNIIVIIIYIIYLYVRTLGPL